MRTYARRDDNLLLLLLLLCATPALPCSCFCAHGMCAALPGAPEPRRAGGGSSPKGRAHDARALSSIQGCSLGKPPLPARAPAGQDVRRARIRGALSLGYFS